MKFTLRYLPKRLTQSDRKKQASMIIKSRKMYKKGKYYKRMSLSSFQTKKSRHIVKAEKIYNVDKIDATNELAAATKCSKQALKDIIRKGEGAYYSSGSRPNQTAQSWGKARLASAITGGKAATVDYSILEKGCNKNSKALLFAKKARKKYGSRTRKAPKVVL